MLAIAIQAPMVGKLNEGSARPSRASVKTFLRPALVDIPFTSVKLVAMETHA